MLLRVVLLDVSLLHCQLDLTELNCERLYVKTFTGANLCNIRFPGTGHDEAIPRNQQESAGDRQVRMLLMRRTGI